MRPFGSYTSSTGDTILLLPEAPAMLLRWRALFLLLLLLPSCGSAQSCRADTGRAHGPRNSGHFRKIAHLPNHRLACRSWAIACS